MCINFGLVCMLAGAFQNQTSGPVHRKFFDKMMLNPTISVMDQKNAERFFGCYGGIRQPSGVVVQNDWWAGKRCFLWFRVYVKYALLVLNMSSRFMWISEWKSPSMCFLQTCKLSSMQTSWVGIVKYISGSGAKSIQYAFMHVSCACRGVGLRGFGWRYRPVIAQCSSAMQWSQFWPHWVKTRCAGARARSLSTSCWM